MNIVILILINLYLIVSLITSIIGREEIVKISRKTGSKVLIPVGLVFLSGIILIIGLIDN